MTGLMCSWQILPHMVDPGKKMDRIERFSRDRLSFDVTDDGPVDGRVIILLHGFPEDRHCWVRLARWLTGAGYRVLAPDQRGYSPGARPAGRRAYTIDRPARDALALADAAGADRFDIVGHDWGAVVAWYLAGYFPGRVRTLTALSVAHPQAFGRSMVGSTQALHSWYMLFFQLPGAPVWLLRQIGGRRIAASLQRSGLGEDSARRYAARAADPTAIRGPLNWYRAIPFSRGDRLGPVATPSLLLWGDRDRFLTRAAAEACERYVTGPYRFVALAGASHWLPSEASDDVAPPLLEHLASVTG
jgi:pimeloyl-ACP methyl ester carboxylesterase